MTQVTVTFDPNVQDDVKRAAHVVAKHLDQTTQAPAKAPAKTTAKPAAAAKTTPAPKPEPEPDPFAEPEPEYKLDDVRKALRAKADASSRDEALAVLKEVGKVASVSELEGKPELWGPIITACKE